MELEVLRSFLLVGRGGGLRAASQRLNLSPAAISLRLKSLEEEIGVKLFEHRPNKLVLTQKGRSFLGRVERVLEDLENSVAGLHENGGICAGNVSVALATDLAFFFAARITAFLKKYPLVKLSMLARSSTNTLELVREDEVDIGIGRFSVIPPSLNRIPLLPIHLVAVYPKRHPLAGSKQVSLRDLSKYGLILHSLPSSTRRAINQILANNAIEITPVVETGWCFAIQQYAKLGLGVGLVHDICVAKEKNPKLRTSDLRHIFGEWHVDLIYKRGRALGSAHQKFIETISRTHPRSKEFSA